MSMSSPSSGNVLLNFTGLKTRSFFGFKIAQSSSSSNTTVFYESDDETTVSTDTTLSRTSSNSVVIYTKFQQVVVASTKSLIIDAGETFVVDAYGLRTPDI